VAQRTIASTGAAHALVASGGTSDAGITLSAPNNRNAKIVLGETATGNFTMQCKGTTDELQVSESGFGLLTLGSSVNGGRLGMTGDFTVGGSHAGPRKATVTGSGGVSSFRVRSDDGQAAVRIQSDSPSHGSMLVAAAPTNQEALFSLLISPQKSLQFTNKRTADGLSLSDGSAELL
jgi:hypothetical protein